MKKILVTGGAGYIGSHTIVRLIEQGYEVISIDNFCNSYPSALKNIESITGVAVQNYDINLCSASDLKQVFIDHTEIDGVIHFAALKYVNESVQEPIKYYTNNVTGMANLLNCCKEFNIQHFVFSSSCSVYGNAKTQPVHEQVAFEKAESPYGRTKQINENMLLDFKETFPLKATMLRYFNPIGAHPSGKLGESPKSPPRNIIPIFNAIVKGSIPKFTIAGDDYETKDGSCVRDYIHVCDLADAHVLALEWLFNQDDSIIEAFNLGSGDGTSVFELVEAFESANNLSLKAVVGPRRNGDVATIYADSSKARSILKWVPEFSLEDMMKTAYNWHRHSSIK